MIQEGNLAFHKEMRKAGNGKYTRKTCKMYKLLFFKTSLKIIEYIIEYILEFIT